MKEFIFDGETIQLPQVIPLDQENFKVMEGEFEGKTFTLKNFKMSGGELTFDATHEEGMEELVKNFVKFIIIASIEKS